MWTAWKGVSWKAQNLMHYQRMNALSEPSEASTEQMRKNDVRLMGLFGQKTGASQMRDECFAKAQTLRRRYSTGAERTFVCDCNFGNDVVNEKGRPPVDLVSSVDDMLDQTKMSSTTRSRCSTTSWTLAR
jgi:hypothetical protein